ncbi:T9SS type B sorting domain-containing protein [Flavobacteriaceae bacterium R38]|nr:T9SS type B sorting domain-containing protein [Flavobacteriaceae bacterium R38]
MRQKLHQTVRWILCCFLLTIFQFSQAQTLNAPELSFAYACASDNFNNFNTIISYDTNPFNTDNVFYLELSDASGSFASPQILKTISDKNFSFEFETSFSFPRDIAGQDYKIRVRSTSPAKISPTTSSFNAYFIPNAVLILNNYEDVAICGGSSATISLNVDVASSYIWYKDGAFYQEAGNSISVTTSGEYHAEAFFGDCTGQLHSNIVIVNFGEEIDARIEGENTVEACPGTTHTLRAVTDNEFLDYRWFRNDVELTDLPPYTPQLELQASDNTYGTYKLSLVNEGGCEAISETISFREPTSNTTTVTAESPLENILLDENSVTLRIATSTSNPRVSWYRNDELVANGISLEYQANEAGTYHAKVSAPGSCLGVVDSPEFKVFDPVSFTALIDYNDDYSSCESINTQINIKSIIAKAVNGFEQDVLPAHFDNFQFNWTKDNASINETGPSYAIESYTENGNYKLESSFNDLDFVSNELNVKLGLPNVTLSSDTEFICSNNGEAVITTVAYEGATYNWYRNGQLMGSTASNTFEVNTDGTFYVVVDINGCSTTSDDLIINLFGEDVISVFPSTAIFIAPNTSEIISASGGDSYLWKDTNGLVVSSADSFTINEPGTYYLVATKNGCEVVKEITAEILEVVEVPNIITPNQDNINDKWVLPAKFINDPEVEVTICDPYGQPVLKTNSYQNNWPENSLTDKNEASIYYYFIQKNGKSVKKGSITVVSR